MTDGYDYTSPIQITVSEMVTKMEDALMVEITRKVGCDIDRDELIKALQYDRAQYDKGFADGKRAAEKHGYWSECYTDSHHYSGICSVCGGGAIRKVKAEPLKYCPCCGARMDLKDGDTNG